MLDPTRTLAIDRAHVWHPYGSAAGSPAHLVESAKGVHLRLVDPDGTRREVVDGMASWWCAIHGYGVPELDAAARAQLDSLSHVMFGGLTHEPAVGLVERLVEMTPEPLTRVFLADSGSVSVEVAMKMALQAQIGRGERGRTRFLTIRGGYHGDTFSPMSVTDPDGGMHSLWKGTLPEHVFAPRPPRAGADPEELDTWAEQVRDLAARHADELAAVIVEPVLQGAGGMHPYDPAAVATLAEVAREHGLLTIHDEIATGFWRTGTRWAGEAAGVVPDILCIGKALTGGYLTLAATLTTEEVAASVSDPRAGGGLMHGPTFMGNPLACAIASASIDLLHAGDPAGEVARIGDRLAAGLTPLRSTKGVVDVRTIGAVGVVQLDAPLDVAAMAAATRAALDAGVWLRPFRDLVYAMPPYACTDADVDTIVAGMAAVAAGHDERG